MTHALVGEIVHCVVHHGASAGDCRPATIVRIQDAQNDIVRLNVAYDDGRDGAAMLDDPSHTISAAHDANKRPGTWHYRTECT